MRHVDNILDLGERGIMRGHRKCYFSAAQPPLSHALVHFGRFFYLFFFLFFYPLFAIDVLRFDGLGTLKRLKERPK